jgi:hypothetical protein
MSRPILLQINIYSILFVKVTPLHFRNLYVFVRFGTFGDIVHWLQIHVVEGVTSCDSFYRRNYVDFRMRLQALIVSLLRKIRQHNVT